FLPGEILHLGLALAAHHVDGALDEITHHRFHIAANVAHFGELLSFDLDERRAGETGEAARDFGLADPRGADEDDVVRGDLLPDLLGRGPAGPAVAPGERARLLLRASAVT